MPRLMNGKKMSMRNTYARGARAAVVTLMAWLMAAGSLDAETGYSTWLRYGILDAAASRKYRTAVPAVVAVLGHTRLERSAQQELIRGVRGMVGRTLRA